MNPESLALRELEVILPPGLKILRRLAFPRKIGFLERIYGRRLAKCGAQLVNLANGVYWKIDLADVTHRWLVYGDYEGPSQMRWIRIWLSKGGLVIDSGANIGQMVASLGFLPGVETLAFEPVASERVWLLDSLRQYPGWRVRVIPCGLGDFEGQAEIRLSGGKSTLRKDWYQSQDLRGEDITVTTLDAFAAANQIDNIRLWKIDVEGFEAEAVRGARRLLSERRIDAMIIECQASTIPALVQGLKPFAYELLILKNGRLRLLRDNDWVTGFFGNLISLPSRNVMA